MGAGLFLLRRFVQSIPTSVNHDLLGRAVIASEAKQSICGRPMRCAARVESANTVGSSMVIVDALDVNAAQF